MSYLGEYHNILKLIDFTLLESHLTAFSIERKLIAVAKESTLFIYSATTKKQLYSIKSYDGVIEKVYFIPNAEDILVVTSNQRVMVYNYKDAHLQARIFSSVQKYKTELPIKITAIAFDKHLVAISTSDGLVTIINLNTHNIYKQIKSTNAPIVALCFSDKGEIIIADSHKDIFVHELSGVKKEKRIYTNLIGIKQLLHITNSDFVIVNLQQDNTLALLDLKSNKIVLNNYLSFKSPISYLEITQEQNLLVMLDTHETLHIKIHNQDELESLIIHNMLTQAYKLASQNPLLQESEEYKKLEKLYSIRYLNAVNALQNEDTQKAHQIVDNCFAIKSKEEELGQLFRAYEHYNNFKHLCAEKKFAPAYALSEKFSPLKYSKEYKDMEAAFKKAYMSAQKHILLSQPTKAKELLTPYLNIMSKQDSINLILKDNRDFLNFLEALKQKNHTKIEQLLSLHPKFSKMPPYQEYQAFLNATVAEIHSAINAAEFESAKEKISLLKGAKLVFEALEKIKNRVEAAEELHKKYDANNFKECYELLDTKPELLQSLLLSKRLEKHWAKLMIKCEKYALYGNAKGIKSTLKELLVTKTRAKRVGQLLRVSFVVQIDELLKEQKFQNAENFIYSYIDIFGTDKEFKQVMKKYEKSSLKKLAINSQTDTNIPRDNWLNNKLITLLH